MGREGGAEGAGPEALNARTGARKRRNRGLLAMSVDGPKRTSGHMRFRAAIECTADIGRAPIRVVHLASPA